MQAVAYLHNKGVAHNQLYPINILHVNPSSPEIKLIDLDEVGNTPIKDLMKFLRFGDYRGCYVAPEVIKGQWNIKNDEFAVGVIMFLFLSGECPIIGSTTEETLKMITEFKIDKNHYAI